ncbi:hypothetical protein BDB00DRAFT_872836 [Zychaea mexicana]|uniref:uncharacterized protein n=1 Tax=Zychaea mexicana TaxID=64656 RepID=UPI0022FEBEA4|nr:uncharacterized protein BDB00DRAFT_872836 [Zychaea mexicana]KAI9492977.1 hypothetical protein BDB00DRAFT_872836 [Zychaea mexicana]
MNHFQHPTFLQNDPYLTLLTEIRDIALRLESSVTNIENVLSLNPQQQPHPQRLQPQQLLSNEQDVRERIAQSYQPSHTALLFPSFGSLDQEKAVAMYHSLSEESKAHKGRLQRPLLSESPSIPMPSPSFSSTRQQSQLPLPPQESEQSTTASLSVPLSFIPPSAPALLQKPTSSSSAVFSIPSSIVPSPQQPAASQTTRLQQGKHKTPLFPPPQRERQN